MPITRAATSSELDLGSIRLHLLDWQGSEPPILLLHPNRTNARVWDFVVEHSTLGNRFLAPDQRGHGLSDYPEAGYRYEHYMADLLALLDELGVQRAHVVGAATGGNIALLLASDHGSRVESLTVIDPGLSLDPAINQRVQTQIAREHTFVSLADARARMPFSERWSDEMKEHYARYSFAIADDGSATWRYHVPGVAETEHMLETPIWDRLTVNCPTLAIRGAESEVFPTHNLEKLCEVVPQTQRLEIDADHRVTQDNPRELAAALDSFIATT
ncbi:MAG: alpha/beta fold hydrolase [Gaiellaceae bacterium]